MTAGEKRFFDETMLDYLVCPLTRSALRYDAERHELRSESAGLAYPIIEGIPVMLPEEARVIDAGG
jgi:hypothetical protein